MRRVILLIALLGLVVSVRAKRRSTIDPTPIDLAVEQTRDCIRTFVGVELCFEQAGLNVIRQEDELIRQESDDKDMKSSCSTMGGICQPVIPTPTTEANPCDNGPLDRARSFPSLCPIHYFCCLEVELADGQEGHGNQEDQKAPELDTQQKYENTLGTSVQHARSSRLKDSHPIQPSVMMECMEIPAIDFLDECVYEHEWVAFNVQAVLNCFAMHIPLTWMPIDDIELYNNGPNPQMFFTITAGDGKTCPTGSPIHIKWSWVIDPEFSPLAKAPYAWMTALDIDLLPFTMQIGLDVDYSWDYTSGSFYAGAVFDTEAFDFNWGALKPTQVGVSFVGVASLQVVADLDAPALVGDDDKPIQVILEGDYNPKARELVLTGAVFSEGNVFGVAEIGATLNTVVKLQLPCPSPDDDFFKKDDVNDVGSFYTELEKSATATAVNVSAAATTTTTTTNPTAANQPSFNTDLIVLGYQAKTPKELQLPLEANDDKDAPDFMNTRSKTFGDLEKTLSPCLKGEVSSTFFDGPLFSTVKQIGFGGLLSYKGVQQPAGKIEWYFDNNDKQGNACSLIIATLDAVMLSQVLETAESSMWAKLKKLIKLDGVEFDEAHSQVIYSSCSTQSVKDFIDSFGTLGLQAESLQTPSKDDIETGINFYAKAHLSKKSKENDSMKELSAVLDASFDINGFVSIIKSGPGSSDAQQLTKFGDEESKPEHARAQTAESAQQRLVDDERSSNDSTDGASTSSLSSFTSLLSATSSSSVVSVGKRFRVSLTAVVAADQLGSVLFQIPFASKYVAPEQYTAGGQFSITVERELAASSHSDFDSNSPSSLLEMGARVRKLEGVYDDEQLASMGLTSSVDLEPETSKSSSSSFNLWGLTSPSSDTKTTVTTNARSRRSRRRSSISSSSTETTQSYSSISSPDSDLRTSFDQGLVEEGDVADSNWITGGLDDIDFTRLGSSGLKQTSSTTTSTTTSTSSSTSSTISSSSSKTSESSVLSASSEEPMTAVGHEEESEEELPKPSHEERAASAANIHTSVQMNGVVLVALDQKTPLSRVVSRAVSALGWDREPEDLAQTAQLQVGASLEIDNLNSIDWEKAKLLISLDGISEPPSLNYARYNLAFDKTGAYISITSETKEIGARLSFEAFQHRVQMMLKGQLKQQGEIIMETSLDTTFSPPGSIFPADLGLQAKYHRYPLDSSPDLEVAVEEGDGDDHEGDDGDTTTCNNYPYGFEIYGKAASSLLVDETIQKILREPQRWPHIHQFLSAYDLNLNVDVGIDVVKTRDDEYANITITGQAAAINADDYQAAKATLEEFGKFFSYTSAEGAGSFKPTVQATVEFTAPLPVPFIRYLDESITVKTDIEVNMPLKADSNSIVQFKSGKFFIVAVYNPKPRSVLVSADGKPVKNTNLVATQPETLAQEENGPREQIIPVIQVPFAKREEKVQHIIGPSPSPHHDFQLPQLPEQTTPKESSLLEQTEAVEAELEGLKDRTDFYVGSSIDVNILDRDLRFDALLSRTQKGALLVAGSASGVWENILGVNGLSATGSVFWSASPIQNGGGKKRSQTLIVCGTAALDASPSLPPPILQLAGQSIESAASCSSSSENAHFGIDLGVVVQHLENKAKRCFLAGLKVSQSKGFVDLVNRYYPDSNIGSFLEDYINPVSMQIAWNNCEGGYADSFKGVVPVLDEFDRRVEKGLNIYGEIHFGKKMQWIDKFFNKLFNSRAKNPGEKAVHAEHAEQKIINYIDVSITPKPFKLAFKSRTLLNIDLCKGRGPCNDQDFKIRLIGFTVGAELESPMKACVSIGGRVGLQLPRKDAVSDYLIFFGEGEVCSSLDIALHGALLTRGGWNAPLGIKFLTLYDVGMGMKLSPGPTGITPVGVSLFGKTKIVDTSLELKLAIDVKDPKRNAFEGQIDNLPAGKLLQWYIGLYLRLGKKLGEGLERFARRTGLTKFIVRARRDAEKEELIDYEENPCSIFDEGCIQPPRTYGFCTADTALVRGVPGICAAEAACRLYGYRAYSTVASYSDPCPHSSNPMNIQCCVDPNSNYKRVPQFSSRRAADYVNTRDRDQQARSEAEIAIEEETGAGISNEADVFEKQVGKTVVACFEMQSPVDRQECENRYSQEPVLEPAEAMDTKEFSPDTNGAHGNNEDLGIFDINIEHMYVRFSMGETDLGAGKSIDKGFELRARTRLWGVQFGVNAEWVKLIDGMDYQVEVVNNNYKLETGLLDDTPPTPYYLAAKDKIYQRDRIPIIKTVRFAQLDDCASACDELRQCGGFYYGRSSVHYMVCYLFDGYNLVKDLEPTVHREGITTFNREIPQDRYFVLDNFLPPEEEEEEEERAWVFAPVPPPSKEEDPVNDELKKGWRSLSGPINSEIKPDIVEKHEGERVIIKTHVEGTVDAAKTPEALNNDPTIFKLELDKHPNQSPLAGEFKEHDGVGNNEKPLFENGTNPAGSSARELLAELDSELENDSQALPFELARSDTIGHVSGPDWWKNEEDEAGATAFVAKQTTSTSPSASASQFRRHKEEEKTHFNSTILAELQTDSDKQVALIHKNAHRVNQYHEAQWKDSLVLTESQKFAVKMWERMSSSKDKLLVVFVNLVNKITNVVKLLSRQNDQANRIKDLADQFESWRKTRNIPVKDLDGLYTSNALADRNFLELTAATEKANENIFEVQILRGYNVPLSAEHSAKTATSGVFGMVSAEIVGPDQKALLFKRKNSTNNNNNNNNNNPTDNNTDRLRGEKSTHVQVSRSVAFDHITSSFDWNWQYLFTSHSKQRLQESSLHIVLFTFERNPYKRHVSLVCDVPMHEELLDGQSHSVILNTRHCVRIQSVRNDDGSLTYRRIHSSEDFSISIKVQWLDYVNQQQHTEDVGLLKGNIHCPLSVQHFKVASQFPVPEKLDLSFRLRVFGKEISQDIEWDFGNMVTNMVNTIKALPWDLIAQIVLDYIDQLKQIVPRLITSIGNKLKEYYHAALRLGRHITKQARNLSSLLGGFFQKVHNKVLRWGYQLNHHKHLIPVYGKIIDNGSDMIYHGMKVYDQVRDKTADFLIKQGERVDKLNDKAVHYVSRQWNTTKSLVKRTKEKFKGF